jgi:hypothetical protein
MQVYKIKIWSLCCSKVLLENWSALNTSFYLRKLSLLFKSSQFTVFSSKCGFSFFGFFFFSFEVWSFLLDKNYFALISDLTCSRVSRIGLLTSNLLYGIPGGPLEHLQVTKTKLVLFVLSHCVGSLVE